MFVEGLACKFDINTYTMSDQQFQVQFGENHSLPLSHRNPACAFQWRVRILSLDVEKFRDELIEIQHMVKTINQGFPPLAVEEMNIFRQLEKELNTLLN